MRCRTKGPSDGCGGNNPPGAMPPYRPQGLLLGLVCLALVLVPAAADSEAGQETGASSLTVNGSPPELVRDPAVLAQGHRIFTVNCSRCHGLTGRGSLGTGGYGPNLRDDEWLHGNRYEDMLKVVILGVPGKPMQSWLKVLGAERIQQVAAYVFSLRFSDPP